MDKTDLDERQIVKELKSLLCIKKGMGRLISTSYKERTKKARSSGVERFANSQPGTSTTSTDLNLQGV